MSKAINSPTGKLLRSSRLFSLPPPLPAAATPDSKGTRGLRFSDTATAPYPTHQAIFTPASSRSRGDWGLKRPLPSRAIPSQTPHLRVKAIDTLEHITDFESAADHTQSLLKWQHMNIPLSIHTNRNSVTSMNQPFNSAFLEDQDNTTLISKGDQDNASMTQRALQNQSLKDIRGRWKSEGPWLSGMSEDEFQRYLFNAVRQHKDEFRDFLAQVKVKQNRAQLERDMRDKGMLQEADPRTLDLELAHESKLKEYELDDWIKKLRDECRSLNDELPQLIRSFFDMPAFSPPHKTAAKLPSSSSSSLLADNLGLGSSTSTVGPPSTHPSAGLSYLLTPAVIDNHPLYGPQAERDPILSRVLKTRSSGRASADLGVGGFVTASDPSVNNVRFNPNTNGSQHEKDPLDHLDLAKHGGNKVWTVPRTASIDEKGRVKLLVKKASIESVGIKTGNPVVPFERPLGSAASGTSTRLGDVLDSPATQQRRPNFAANARFGQQLSNQNLPRAQDSERWMNIGSSRGGQQRQQRRDGGARSAVSAIEDLLPRKQGREQK